ncbi:hypothetical protein BpHYR1_018208 [Brachionus plicatilis]|uniref:Uncharacterized protein n=1 Tax=Brachionus plicatilis TaxID=10195 RepID=A0A3M7S2H4_BRAPC|nr:hypothetical protein BpHYR1_018208 [Brachionus plicatilis]
MEKVEYLDPSKHLLIFENYKFHRKENNTNGSVRWRCEACKTVSLTVDSNDNIIRKPKPNVKHIPHVCIKLFPVQKHCLPQYEFLKHEAKNDPNFNFLKRYREILQQLQAANDPRNAEYF